MTVPRERLLALMEAQCRIFSTTFNPDGVRMGNKILRQKLRGPALASYYPRRVYTVRDFQKEVQQMQLSFDDEEELDRLEKIQELKDRGKGAPKKKSAPTDTKKR